MKYTFRDMNILLHLCITNIDIFKNVYILNVNEIFYNYVRGQSINRFFLIVFRY